MYWRTAFGLGLLSCLLALGCGHHRRCCIRPQPQVVNTVPVAPAPPPCCNGVPAPAPVPVPPGGTAVPAPVPAFSSPAAPVGVVVPNH